MTAEPANDAASAPPSASRPRWVRTLPILVLVVAIVGQITLMTTANTDRQTGSGFAMFSSVDFAASRSIVVTATFNGQPVDVELPASMDNQVDQLLYAPTDSGAERLASDLATTTWTEQDAQVVVGDTGSIEHIVVVVRGLTANGRELGSQVLAQGTTE